MVEIAPQSEPIIEVVVMFGAPLAPGFPGR
jgi:hypothetical protein